ncbi:SspB family protein [Acuticoccus yangtzensis]|uniref:SspB family protein n=1 Tax=Acuticoccus yangtzensis TaxID=1443441 RepID=UPI000949845C|nr:SspB family protein [Acuticoccus yangtzensis]
MADDLIRYDVLVQDALRGVVRKVMREVAEGGLPGDHHFYIAFDTTAPGVRMSSRLRQQHPEEMTVVLQHQFWDLAVSEHGFEVGLSFGGVPERLLVPFAAVKGFFDPSVQFGLQFDPATASQPAADGPAAPAAAPPAGVSPLPKAGVPAPSPSGEKPSTPPSEGAAEDKPKEGAEVVSLDAFRKKP